MFFYPYLMVYFIKQRFFLYYYNMTDTNESTVMIFIYTNRNKRFSELFSLFCNEVEIPLKKLSLQVSSRKLYLALNDLDKFNKCLSKKHLPSVLSYSVMDHHGKHVKSLKKNVYYYSIDVSPDLSCVSLTYSKRRGNVDDREIRTE